ncbi:MAG: hypothetical protein ACKOCK_02560 [Chloroflexota bacterium]
MNVEVSKVGNSGRLLSWMLALSALTVIIVLVQAAIAGQWFFLGRASWILTHGWLGSVGWMLVIAVGLMAAWSMWKHHWGRAEFVLSVVLGLLMTAQLGLGYMGREMASAAAWHIPNGVLIVMVAMALTMLTWFRGRLPN